MARSSGALLAMGSAIAIVFLIIGLVRHGIVPTSVNSSQKDYIDVISAITGISIAILASFFSYLRFFMGRTFVRRAKIELSSKLVAGPNGRRLCCVIVTVLNSGNLPIYDPALIVTANDYLNDGTERHVPLPGPFDAEEFLRVPGISVVDVGETATFRILRELPPEIWATCYSVIVADRSGCNWSSYELSSIEETSGKAAKRTKAAG